MVLSPLLPHGMAATQVQKPGSRGGRVYKTKTGTLRYGHSLQSIKAEDDKLATPFPVVTKPYSPPPGGMLSQEATLKTVSLDKLEATQTRVTEGGVQRYLREVGKRKPPLVYKTADGRHIIEDGHHRLTADWAKGKKSARVLVVTEKTGGTPWL